MIFFYLEVFSHQSLKTEFWISWKWAIIEMKTPLGSGDPPNEFFWNLTKKFKLVSVIFLRELFFLRGGWFTPPLPLLGLIYNAEVYNWQNFWHLDSCFVSNPWNGTKLWMFSFMGANYWTQNLNVLWIGDVTHISGTKSAQNLDFFTKGTHLCWFIHNFWTSGKIY